MRSFHLGITMDDLATLQAQIAELQRKESELKQKNKHAVLEELKAKMKSYGITLDELGSVDRGSSRQKVAVLIKYRHSPSADSFRSTTKCFTLYPSVHPSLLGTAGLRFQRSARRPRGSPAARRVPAAHGRRG